YPIPNAFIQGISSANVQLGLDQLEKRGFIKRDGNKWLLSKKGTEMAVQDAHNQQLWDIYREYNDELDLPLIQEDRQKDIHEVLPQAAIEKLELKLKGMLA